MHCIVHIELVQIGEDFIRHGGANVLFEAYQTIHYPGMHQKHLLPHVERDFRQFAVEMVHIQVVYDQGITSYSSYRNRFDGI